MGISPSPTIDLTSITDSSNSSWALIKTDELSSQLPLSKGWYEITPKELSINSSLEFLSQVDYRNFTTDASQQVRETLEGLINVFMPEGADSLTSFDSNQEKLLPYIRDYFEHSPTLDSACMVKYWIHATVDLPYEQADQRKTSFHRLIQLMSSDEKQKTCAVINRLVESYAYALAHAHGVKDDLDQKAMLTQISDALEEEGKIIEETRVQTLNHLVAAFRRIKASDNKSELQRIFDKLFAQVEAELRPKDKYCILYTFIYGVNREAIPVDWALDKADILLQKDDLFSPEEILAEKAGDVMLELARYFCQAPELSNQIRRRVLTLFERLTQQPILPPQKRPIYVVFEIAQGEANPPPLMDRLRQTIEKLKIFSALPQEPFTLV